MIDRSAVHALIEALVQIAARRAARLARAKGHVAGLDGEDDATVMLGVEAVEAEYGTDTDPAAPWLMGIIGDLDRGDA